MNNLGESKETYEELQEKINQLTYELNLSLQIESNLANKLGRKEHELTVMEIKLEEVTKGFEELRKANKELETKAE